ncbi:RING finger and SPRY domain-containing protein 1 [Dissophora ornata]|nr:RING finger and SPRY domain-containing protein 1 [Dissophora ornata]
MATRLLERVFVKVHIRAAWNKLHNMTEHGELSSALESLIHLTATGGLARLRSKKKNKPVAALIWSVLANRLAGEMSSALFSDAVCECLLNNIEHDPDMSCKVFSIIALEKFSLTGPCKARIMQTPIRRLLQEVANMSTDGLTDQDEICGILQAKFCAEWSLRNIFRDVTEGTKTITDTDTTKDYSPLITQVEDDISKKQGGLSPSENSTKSSSPKPTNINVMLNTLDATRHWKISEDGLSIRNDGSSLESIRATKSVSQGKWYYEVTLVTAGIMQLGWATIHSQFSPEDGTGIGDDIFGFAYDGCRNLIWVGGESDPYGECEAWKAGDVVGFYLDIDNAVMECFINGKSLGKISPFERDHFGIQAISGYYPALSFTSFQQASVNFGATPFKYPPALPWRNINDHGTITPEMRQAIIRPRNDSVYGRIQVDPTTGIRLPSMPEDESEIDYSLLCTICCDHTATVTLQPCGHDGLCIECAYSLDMCPLCRCRIFQRQMFPSGESKDAGSPSGLGISGLSSDASSTNTSAPGLSTSSTSTTAWSAEYCGPSVTNPINREPTPTNNSCNYTGTSAAAAAAVIAAAVSEQYPSTESLSRRRNTVAASSPSVRAAMGLDDLEDPFSPPSTAYFAFLNRPARTQRSQLHPMDMDSVDPLEMPVRRPQQHPLSAPAATSSVVHENQSTLPPHPLSPMSEDHVALFDSEGPVLGLGLGFSDDVGDADSDIEDSGNGMDVVLVEEGREASDSEVMEQSAPDFMDGHSIHSRRSSVQVLQGLQGSSLPPIGPGPTMTTIGITTMTTPTTVEELVRLAAAIPVSSSSTSNASGASNMGIGMGMNMGMGMNAGGAGTARFGGGRRASMPSNRLEM